MPMTPLYSGVDDLNVNLATQMNKVVDWINNNKLILNVFKMNCIVIGTNHSLSPKPKLNLTINKMLIKQQEDVKLLRVIIDNK